MFEALPALPLLAIALLVGLFGGFVKGVVGFALPVILVSGIGTFLSPELALASFVVPAVVTNLWQGLRQGPSAAIASLSKFRLLVGVALVMIVLTAQLVPSLPHDVLLASLGLPIALICLSQLSGWRPKVDPANKLVATVAGFISGAFGGLAGVFGPPFIVYLTAINTAKEEQVRVLGVVFSIALLVYTAAHTVSGIVHWDTLVFSAIVTVPVLIGTQIGFRFQDRVDQDTFRKLTLIVLLLAGLNLLRKAFVG